MKYTNLSDDLVIYYERRFFLQTYGGDQARVEYEWNYYQSPLYKLFIGQANNENATHRPYTDKRTRGWRHYLANKQKVRSDYELWHPMPVSPVKEKSTMNKTITFSCFSPWGASK